MILGGLAHHEPHQLTRKARGHPYASIVATPAYERSDVWTPRGPVQRLAPEITLWHVMTDPDLDIARPPRAPVSETTAIQNVRYLSQWYTELGYDVDGDDPTPWEHQQPPWRELYTLAGDRLNRVKHKGKRLALHYVCALWGVYKTMPPFLAGSWYKARDVAEAKARGVSETRERFLTPDDIRTLLASHPFTDTLKPRGRAEEAAYNDALFRHLVSFGSATGPRPGEYALLRMENVDLESPVPTFRGWEQEKKAFQTRTFTIPEREIVHGDARRVPSLMSYLTRYRPGGLTAPGPVFLQVNGEPYTSASLANLIRRGINKVLGPEAASAHALRRFAATWARHHGWTISSIASMLGDDEDTIKGSYLDHAWLDGHESERPNGHREGKFPRLVLRSNGQRGVFEQTATGFKPVPGFSSEATSGSVQTQNAVPRRNGEQTTPESASDADAVSLFFSLTTTSHGLATGAA